MVLYNKLILDVLKRDNYFLAVVLIKIKSRGLNLTLNLELIYCF